MNPPPASEQPGDELEFEQLLDQTSRDVRYGNLPAAQEEVARLLEIRPDSTTVQELHGDLQRALGNRQAARAAYAKALELEPANADAERKLAEMILFLGEEGRIRDALLSGDTDAYERVRGKRVATSGALKRSALFPGLGQIYRGDVTAGLIMAGVGLLLVLLAIGYLFPPLTRMLIEVRRGGTAPGPGFVGWAALAGYLALYVYSLYDAQRGSPEER